MPVPGQLTLVLGAQKTNEASWNFIPRPEAKLPVHAHRQHRELSELCQMEGGGLGWVVVFGSVGPCAKLGETPPSQETPWLEHCHPEESSLALIFHSRSFSKQD